MSDTLVFASGTPLIAGAGEVIAGKYRLERELGRGAMGTVWSAVHLTLGQRVAIKLIAPEHAQSAEARQRFSTEAKAAGRLKSRFVVQVYDDGETATGTPYIVLEYLEGETLEQRLERERTIPLNDAVRITRHVARALSRAHAQGIVHRDLKPGNVFLTRLDDEEYGWIAKVLDFGIAKLEEHGRASTTRAGTVLGTPLFMSPEQIRGASQVDLRADLYSLGMVFYNMLTGNYAFDGETFSDILIAICTQPLPDLRARAPSVPVSVGAWFQRACAADAARRFQSADEMLEALEMAVGVTGSGGASARGSAPDMHTPIGTLHGYSPPVEHTRPRGPAHTPAASGAGTQVLTSNPMNLAPSHVTIVDPTLRSAPPIGPEPIAMGGDSTFSVQHIETPRPTARPRTWLLAAGVLLLSTMLGGGLLWAMSAKRVTSSSAEPAAQRPPSPPLQAAPAPEPSVTATATAEAPAAPEPVAAPPAAPAAPAPSSAGRPAIATKPAGNPKTSKPPSGKPASKTGAPASNSASKKSGSLDMGF